MVKKIILLSLFGFATFVSAQQTAQFRLIKEKYDTQIENFNTICKKDLIEGLSLEVSRQIYKQCRDGVLALNANRNKENLQELARVKIEGTGNIVDTSKFATISNVDGETIPEYFGGNTNFRNEISGNFDADAINGDGIFKSEIAFIIERDGTISNVNATGTDEDFNRQAELAVYLVKHNFSIARINGVPVRYRMKVPLTLSFE